MCSALSPYSGGTPLIHIIFNPCYTLHHTTCPNTLLPDWRAVEWSSSQEHQVLLHLREQVAQICLSVPLPQLHQPPQERSLIEAVPEDLVSGGMFHWDSRHSRWPLWTAVAGWDSNWTKKPGCPIEDYICILAYSVDQKVKQRYWKRLHFRLQIKHFSK